MTATAPLGQVYPFRCAHCGGNFASNEPGADRCGYCEARHDQKTRQQAGWCGFGCRTFNNICPNQLVPNGSGFCADHQPAGYEPPIGIAMHAILTDLRVNGAQTAAELDRLPDLTGTRAVTILDALMDEGMVTLHPDNTWHRVS